MDMLIKQLAFAGCQILAATAWASDPVPVAAPSAPPLCATLEAAKATAPSFDGAPRQADLPSQACTKLPGGAWGCELKLSDGCARVERGSEQDFGKVFGGALDDAMACYTVDKGYVRRDTEKFENDPGVRKRILREASWMGPGTTEPVVVASADVVLNYASDIQDKESPAKSCSIVSITLRLENARRTP